MNTTLNSIRQKHYRHTGMLTSKSDRVTVGTMMQFNRAVADARPPVERRALQMPAPVALHLSDARVMLFDPQGVASGNAGNARRATMTRAIDDLTTRLSAPTMPAARRATGYRIV